jgi:glutathione S-transferase
MKLYYKAGACSLSPHIVLAELNMVYELESVDLVQKTCASGDFWKINPKGSVPALRMDNGEILTEGAVIVQYLADQKPEMELMPKLGTLERYRCLELLNYITSDIHKNFSPLFYADRILKEAHAQTELKTYTKEVLGRKIAVLSSILAQQDYLMGKQFTVADAYFFTCLSWAKYVALDLSAWSNLLAYQNRITLRPSVIKAMKEEGLL